MGELMGVDPQAMRFAVLGIETIYRGVQTKSSCDVLHGIQIFAELKKHTEYFDDAFDLLIGTMEKASPKKFSCEEEKEYILYAMCFLIPSLLRGIKPSRCLVEFGGAYAKLVHLSQKVKIDNCDLNEAKTNLLRAKVALEDEWNGSRLVQIFLHNILTPLFESSEPPRRYSDESSCSR
jgi:hypothetical protein